MAIKFQKGPAASRLLSTLAGSTIDELDIDVWSDDCLVELGTKLRQCNLIFSLKINLMYIHYRLDDIESFFREGIANMQSLTHLDIRCRSHAKVFTPSTVNAIGSVASNLQHFAMSTPECQYKKCDWLGLGSALRSVKSISLQLQKSDEPLRVLLLQLQSCESLKLDFHSLDTFQESCSIIAHLPTIRRVRAVVVGKNHDDSEDWKRHFLVMITSSNSITDAVLDPMGCQDQVESRCIVNRVFNTCLIGFGPTELWTRVLDKVRDESTSQKFLFRLLREKPDLVLASRRQDFEMETYEDLNATPEAILVHPFVAWWTDLVAAISIWFDPPAP